MAAPASNIEPKQTLPSIREFFSKDPMLPTTQEYLRKAIPFFVVSSEQNLSNQCFHIPDNEDEDEARKLRRQRRIERNRQLAIAFRQRIREQAEDVRKQLNFLSWDSKYTSVGDVGGPPTYQKAIESQDAGWKVITDFAAGVPQVPESPRRMSRVVEPVDVALEERRRRSREAQRAYRKHVQSHIQELEQQVERIKAGSQNISIPTQSATEDALFHASRYEESLFEKKLPNGGLERTADHGLRVTGDRHSEQFSIKSKILGSLGAIPLREEIHHYASLHESSVDRLRRILGSREEFVPWGRSRHDLGSDGDDSLESMIAAADAVFFSDGLSERVRWDWSTHEQDYSQIAGYGTASSVYSRAKITDRFRSPAVQGYFPNIKGIGTKLRFEKPIPWGEQDQLWMRKYGKDTSQWSDLQDDCSAPEEGRYSGCSWPRFRRILDGNGKLATALIFMGRFTGTVASSTESRPASPESLLETTMLAACLGVVFTAVIYLERRKEVLTQLMIVMPFACLDLGREIAFPERQLLLVATFSASLNIAWLKAKLADLPRTGGLTALLIATFGFLSACAAAYYLPAMGGRYADRFILAAVSTLFTTMIWSVVWVVCFHNLGLAQRLEVGEYDEHIGAFTKRIFETWINQLITHVCESLISRLVGSNSLPTGLKQHAGDVESVPAGGLSRRESFWTAVDAPPTPPQSWPGDMFPSTQ